jgi:hypothetical protein
MRRLFIILLFLPLLAESQITVRGKVSDARSHEALAFCNVAVKGQAGGTITNAEGRFQLNLSNDRDSLIFSYLGYQSMTIQATALLSNPEVFLKPGMVQLQELVIRPEDDYLYEILDKCRRKMKRDQGSSVSKAYFALETTINFRTAEFLEAYYNAGIKGIIPEELKLKNGRLGLAVIGSRIFNNWETSIVISKLDLLNENYLFPAIPLQFGKRELKKYFRLQPGQSDSSMIHVLFTPDTNAPDAFSGDLWISKKSNNLLKIQLKSENLKTHPFVSYIDDSISNVSMEITQTFIPTGACVSPTLTCFDYSMKYVSGSNNARISDTLLPDMARTINTHSVLYFYDYSKPFLLPYFEYDKELGDYIKIAMIPYNEAFWNNNNAVLLSDEQKTKLGVMLKDGYLINFKEGNYGQDFCRILYNDRFRYHVNYTFWSKDKRIFFTNGLEQTQPYPPEKINQHIPGDLYKLKVQILLDMNPVNDTLDLRTYTVFDEAQTFFHLQRFDYTAAFLNIYFDICEIERRKIESSLHKKQCSLQEIDAIYKAGIAAMDLITQKYLSEVETGKNTAALEKWNSYVFENLGIDNLGIFGLKK